MSSLFNVILYDVQIKKYCCSYYRTEMPAKVFFSVMKKQYNVIPILITQDERVKDFLVWGKKKSI